MKLAILPLLIFLALPAEAQLIFGTLGNPNTGSGASFAPAYLSFSSLPQYGDGNQICIATYDGNGNFIGYTMNPQDYFGQAIFTYDTNTFVTADGVVYARNPVIPETYPALQTNLTAWLAANTVYYTNYSTNLDATIVTNVSSVNYFSTSNRVILGNVPSFASAQIDGYVSGGMSIAPSLASAVQFSADGGNTWKTGTTNGAVLVSLYDPNGHADSFASVTVFSWLKPEIIGGTNDFGAQTLFLDLQNTSARSIPNIGYVSAAIAQSAANWSGYPANSAVNLAGNDLNLDSRWSVTTQTNALKVRLYGQDVFTMAPGNPLGALPTFVTNNITSSNVNFTINCDVMPTVVYSTNLLTPMVMWEALPGQTNWTDGTNWFVTAPLPANRYAFFRASGITNAGTPSVTFNALVTGLNVTNGVNGTNGTNGLTGYTNTLSSVLTPVNGTNVQINLAGFTNSSQCTFYVLANTNLYFDLITNAPAGFQFSVEISQAGTNTVTFNTTYSTTAAAWVPSVQGQFLALPTNSTLCRQIVSVQIGHTGTNAYMNQINFTR